MNNNQIDLLIEKYISGEASDEEGQMVEQYLLENPLNAPEVMLGEKKLIGKRIKKKLLENTFPGRRKTLRLWSSAAAASLLIGAGIMWYILPVSKNYVGMISSVIGEQSDALEVRNSSRKPQRLTLDDGSEVVLQPGSRISYPERFGESKRIVSLHGEAFFKVKRDPSKPFVVSTENLATQVLGTSFNVRSYDGAGSIEVQVLTGKVSVYEVTEVKAASKNGVILTPNQKMVFDKKSRKLELGIVKNPVIVKALANTGNFTFSETPVTEALSMLEKSYGIDIVVEGDMLGQCLFTGDLNGLSMFDQLGLICRSVNVDYEQRGTSLFISGAGCPKSL